MKAWIADDYGPPSHLRLGDIEAPVAGNGDVTVRIHAAAVNPFDVKLITGAVKDFAPLKAPYVPGMDGSGVIASAGGGVTGYAPGDAVLGFFRAGGTLGEFAVISAASNGLAKKPASLDYEHAAALPEAGLTAMTILRALNLSEGQRLMIVGATGGLGLFLTQLARLRGVHVTATARPDERTYVSTLGADEDVDYTAGNIVAQVRERHVEGVDALADVVNSGESLLTSAGVLKRGGTLVSSLYGPPESAYANDVKVRYIQNDPQPGDLSELARLASSGKLRIEIGATYPFSEAPKALSDLLDPATHTRGKLVVKGP
jgi:NADPH:quinone reductase-like Zn-dependent oxidoreductase